MNISYDELYNILLNAGFTDEQIIIEIKEKKKNYHDYISDEGSLFLVAKDHNLIIEQEIYDEIEDVDIDEFVINISEVNENMTNIVIIGKISKVFGINSFMHKDGTPGRVGSFMINDGTGEIKIVLWNEQVKIIKNKYFKVGELIRILNGYCRKNKNESLEIHISKKGKIVLSPDNVELKRFPQLQYPNFLDQNEIILLNIKKLYEKVGYLEYIEGNVLKIESFKEKKLQNNDITFFLKFILEDDTSTIPVIVWGMQAVICIKLIDEGISLRLTNLVIKVNPYSKTKEIHFTKKTELTII